MRPIPILKTGVLRETRKGDSERRLPIHPNHILEGRIPTNLLRQMLFEQEYGLAFGMPDMQLAELTCGRVGTRNDVLERTLVIAPKLTLHELHEAAALRADHGQDTGTLFCGWPHFELGHAITQAAIDGQHSVLAWEGFFEQVEGRRVHTFSGNNRMAGYAGIIHMLGILGMDGFYGPPCKVAVFSHGWVSKGMIQALWYRGYRDITVFTARPPEEITDAEFPAVFKQIRANERGRMMIIEQGGAQSPLIGFLAQCGIICNGTLQDKLRPKCFVHADEQHRLQPGVIIGDISCDEGPMGFAWAVPTHFAEPWFRFDLGNGHHGVHYAVDHTPTFLWQAATAQISGALIPYLPQIMAGTDAWLAHPVLGPAAEIVHGHVRNERIIQFQRRAGTYPHEHLG